MRIRELSENNQFDVCLDLQRQIWGMRDIDVVPTHIFRAFGNQPHPYGIILGAYYKSQMVGFLLGMPTSQPETLLMHMIGVIPPKQASGFGYQLMLRLKQISKARGYHKIVWTLDPLESVNANLYISKMKATGVSYMKDYYTMHHSKIHEGVPMDRLMMEMYLSNEDRKKNLHLNTGNRFEIEIPGNFQEIKKKNIDLAKQLREKTRVLFGKMNDEHYVVTDFEYDKDQRTGKYILMKSIV